MSKYYIPDISEFHVGFEYEVEGWIVDSTKIEPNTITPENKKIWREEGPPEGVEWIGWQKKTWTASNNMLNTFDVEHTSEYQDKVSTPDFYRVKYLDKEDIESLGYRDVGQYEYLLNGWTLEYAGTEEEPHRWRIDDFEKDGLQIMWFIIKNKSELSRLMNQLGINDA